MMESEPLVDTDTLSDFVGLAKEKWQNRNNNQTNPNTPKENIFQRMGKGIKETVEGLGDPKELREYKRMTRDMERAARECYMDPEKEDKWWNKGIAKANNIVLSHQEKGQISKYSLTSLMSLTPEEIQELLERSKRRKNSK